MNVRANPFVSLGFLFATFVTFATTRAFGEPTAADKSLATQLFRDGRALVEQGRVAEGCRRLEESQRLDPGGGTLLNVALCHEKEGRSATAWAEFTEALGIARRDERPQRVELAQAHIAALEPTLSRLVIQIPPAAELPDLEVKRDGGLIRRAAWGTAMPVDPGEHVVEASAPGKASWKQSVTLGAKSDTKTVVVPVLENVTATAPSPTPGPSPVAARDTDTKPANHAPAAWVAMGLGVAAVGVGSYFGLRAMSEQKTADRDCPDEQCSPDGVAANSRAINAANLATAGFAVGLVGIGLGTFLFLTNGPSRSPSSLDPGRVRAAARLGATSSELVVSGSW